jgi:site-specific recombinase XerD
MRLGSDFLAYCSNVRGYKESTVTTYAAAIDNFEKVVGVDDPANVTLVDLDSYMTAMTMTGIAVATRRTRSYALKSFFNFLKKRDLIGKNPCDEFFPPDDEAAAISVLSEIELREMIFMPQPADRPRGSQETVDFYERRLKTSRLCFLRDSALIGLSYVCALRSGEIKTLRRDDLSFDGNGGCSINLRGKGAREVKPYFVDAQVARLIVAYQEAQAEAGIDHPALFCSSNPKHKGTNGLNATSVCLVFDKRLKAAKINSQGRKLTPHVLRYSRATHLDRAKAQITEIRDFMRHRTSDTTLRYIRLGSARSVQRKFASHLLWNRRFPGVKK